MSGNPRERKKLAGTRRGKVQVGQLFGCGDEEPQPSQKKRFVPAGVPHTSFINWGVNTTAPAPYTVRSSKFRKGEKFKRQKFGREESLPTKKIAEVTQMVQLQPLLPTNRISGGGREPKELSS